MKVNNTIRKNIIFPIDLISRFETLNKILRIDFSSFVRDAIEEKLKRIEKEWVEVMLLVMVLIVLEVRKASVLVLAVKKV